MGVFDVIPSVAAVKVPFTPASLSNVLGWYDLSDETSLFTDAGVTPVSADGDRIYQVNDKSGNGKHLVQATLGLRPTLKRGIQNGRSIGRFDGATNYMACASVSWALPLSIYATVSRDLSTTNDTIVDGSTTRVVLYYVASQTYLNMWAGGGSVYNTGTVVASTGAFHVVEGLFNGATLNSGYVDGVVGVNASVNIGTNTLAGLLVGAGQGPGDYFDGDIGEIAVFSGIDGTAARDRMETYMGQGWNVAVA